MVYTWKKYNTNGYIFNTIAYGERKRSMNSGICIRGTCYNEEEADYYGLVEDIIELEYHNPTEKKTVLVLFKCNWYDSTENRGWRKHPKHDLVEVNVRRKFHKYEPFVFASQAQQVYYVEYASKKKKGLIGGLFIR